MSTLRVSIPSPSPVARSLSDLTHGELARALAANSDWAAGEIWQRFAPAVVKLATRTLGSSSDAEDAAQEVFFRVFAKAHTLRDAERLPGFIFAFAVRVLKTEQRRRKTHARVSFCPPATMTELGFGHPNVEARDLLRRFSSLLERLAPRPQLAFVLRHVKSFRVDEVAAQMELSLATVKRALNRARGKLSRWIEADEELAAFFDGRGWAVFRIDGPVGGRRRR
jgi:RNA polymerase sigma-70 factor (ECF subfamily)